MPTLRHGVGEVNVAIVTGYGDRPRSFTLQRGARFYSAVPVGNLAMPGALDELAERVSCKSV
jgi:hypothetical protein